MSGTIVISYIFIQVPYLILLFYIIWNILVIPPNQLLLDMNSTLFDKY